MRNKTLDEHLQRADMIKDNVIVENSQQAIVISLPPMVEGQTGWEVYQSAPRYETPKDSRSRKERMIYSSLMWLHDKAESVWHWAWAKSRKFAPPDSQIAGYEHKRVS